MAQINVQLTPDGPISTLDESELVKKHGVFENENERTSWVEFRLKSDPDNPRAVHRSAHVQLKKSIFSEGALATLA